MQLINTIPSYAKRAIKKGLQCVEAGRDDAQAIPAA
jgi:hypothetical protein